MYYKLVSQKSDAYDKLKATGKARIQVYANKAKGKHTKQL